MDPKQSFMQSLVCMYCGGSLVLVRLGKWAATGNPDIQAIGSWARQVYASLGKSAATANPDVQAIGSWARQV